MSIENILQGLTRFQKRVYPAHQELFRRLASGQRPNALFITCADSRIDPCMLTQSKPGDLFICRVIGNIVPVYPKTIGGVSATIEYAAGVLAVPDIIVCGHTDCGVIKGILNGNVPKSFPNVTAWLRHAQSVRRVAAKREGQLASPNLLISLTERNVVEQLQNLRTHPAVAARLRKGNLRLHGWLYHIGQGIVTAYDPGRDAFFPIRASESRITKSGNSTRKRKRS